MPWNAELGFFQASNMAIVNGYVTLNEFKGWVGLDIEDDEHDSEIELAIEASSRGIDIHTKRAFYKIEEARFFRPETSVKLWLGAYNDLDVLDELAVDDDSDGDFETIWEESDYELEPLNRNAGPEPRPYERIRARGRFVFPRLRTSVRVTGMWGWPAIPDAIRQATLIQTNRLFKRKDSPEGTIGLNMFGTVRMGRLDADVRRLIHRYQRKAVG